MCGEFEITLGKLIGIGSNSYVYQCEKFKNHTCNLLAVKCTKNPIRYYSFQLQYESMLKCKDNNYEDIIMVSPIFWGQCKDIGEVLIMKEMKNIYNIDFVINNGVYYGELIISNIAKAIAFLHNNYISGYDVEFFWDVINNKLVVLDIGPLYTFNVSYETMLREHWKSLQCNEMGRWNMLSLILPIDRAEVVKNNDVFTNDLLEELLLKIDENSMALHLEDVAKIHSINIIGKLNKASRTKYLKLFKKVYLDEIKNVQFANVQYINFFEKFLSNKKLFAIAKLYYPKKETLCHMSCSSISEWA